MAPHPEPQPLELGKTRFEDAVATLPVSAPSSVELQWIRTHPAMSRATRRGAHESGPIVVTASEVLEAPHGPAPSQGAARDLQYWVNNQREFYKTLLGEQKKSQAKPKDEELELESLKEVERLLRPFSLKLVKKKRAKRVQPERVTRCHTEATDGQDGAVLPPGA